MTIPSHLFAAWLSSCAGGWCSSSGECFIGVLWKPPCRTARLGVTGETGVECEWWNGLVGVQLPESEQKQQIIRRTGLNTEGHLPEITRSEREQILQQKLILKQYFILQPHRRVYVSVVGCKFTQLLHSHYTEEGRKSRRGKELNWVAAWMSATGATKMQIGSPSGVTSRVFLARPEPGVLGASLLLFFYCNNWL